MSPSTDEDDLFGVPQDLPSDSGPWPFDGAPILSPGDAKLVPESAPVKPAVTDPLLDARAETSSGTDTDADVVDDHSSLFAFVKKKPKEAQPESLFSQAPTLPTKDDVNIVRNSLTDEDVDDDLFKPSAAVKKIVNLGSGAKTWRLSDDEDDDDLFSTGGKLQFLHFFLGTDGNLYTVAYPLPTERRELLYVYFLKEYRGISVFRGLNEFQAWSFPFTIFLFFFVCRVNRQDTAFY